MLIGRILLPRPASHWPSVRQPTVDGDVPFRDFWSVRCQWHQLLRRVLVVFGGPSSGWRTPGTARRGHSVGAFAVSGLSLMHIVGLWGIG